MRGTLRALPESNTLVSSSAISFANLCLLCLPQHPYLCGCQIHQAECKIPLTTSAFHAVRPKPQHALLTGQRWNKWKGDNTIMGVQEPTGRVQKGGDQEKTSRQESKKGWQGPEQQCSLGREELSAAEVPQSCLIGNPTWSHWTGDIC